MKRILLSMIVGAAVVGASDVFAKSTTFNAKKPILGGSDKWSGSSNWSNGTPSSGDGVSLYRTSENDLSGLSLNFLSCCASTYGEWELTGNALTLNGETGLCSNTDHSKEKESLLTVSTPLTVGRSQSWNVWSPLPAIVVNGAVTVPSDCTVTKEGAGTIEIATSNPNWMGPVVVTGGVLRVSAASVPFGGVGCGAIKVFGNAAAADSETGNGRGELRLCGTTLANDVRVWDVNNHPVLVADAAKGGAISSVVLGKVTTEANSFFPASANGGVLVLGGGLQGFSDNLYLRASGSVVLSNATDSATYDLGTIGYDANPYSWTVRLATKVRFTTGSGARKNGIVAYTPSQTVVFDVDDALDLENSTKTVRFGICRGTLDLNGHDQHIDGFVDVAASECFTNGEGKVTSATPAVLYVNQNVNDVKQPAYGGMFAGAVGLSKSGDKALYLGRANGAAVYHKTTGRLEVTAGELQLLDGCHWMSDDVRVSGGTLSLGGAGNLAKSSLLQLSDDGKVWIKAGAQTIGGLTINGQPFVGKIGSAAAKALDPEVVVDEVHFSSSGGGYLLVTGTATAGTAVWTGAAGTGVFSDSGNWQDGVLPQGADVVLSGEGTIFNDINDARFRSLSLSGTMMIVGNPMSVAGTVTATAGRPRLSVPLSFGGAASFEAAAGAEISYEGGIAALGDRTLVVKGPGALKLTSSVTTVFRRTSLVGNATLSFESTPVQGFRTAVLDVGGGSVLDVAAGAWVDAYSVFYDNGAPLSQGMYSAGSPSWLTGSGRLQAATVAAVSPDARTANVLSVLKDTANAGKWLASWRTTWFETNSRFRAEDAGGYVSKPPEEVEDALYSVDDVSKSIAEKSGLANPFPYLYAVDFSSVAGTWYSGDYYARNRATLRSAIRAAFKYHHSMPIFSWHFENPYVWTGWSDTRYGNSMPSRCRQASECPGYPTQHQYMLHEVLSNGGDVCGMGRSDGSVGLSVANPRQWFESRFDEIADFLETLVDENGRRIPVIIRLMHECEDKWSCWGRTAVTVEDYRLAFRYMVESLRWRLGGGNLLFAYCPDRNCTVWGTEGDSEGTADDSERVFMARYPGDDFVDIIGCDDYTIGANSGDDAGESWWSRLIGGNFNKDTEKQTTIAYLRNLTTEAANRGKACGLFETGIKGQEGDSYKTHYEVLTASGVRMGFVNTWGGATIPNTNAGIDSWWGGYLNKANVLWSPKDSVDLPGNPMLPTVILKYW